MAANDFAIIIGVQRYPGLDDPENGNIPLQGPENDAIQFKAWAISPNGGQVPEENVRSVLSSNFENPNIRSKAKPAMQEIIEIMESFHPISETNIKSNKGPRVGRRLYIFMSGHGIAPTPYGNKTEKESALLMANVDPKNTGIPRYHIPGTYSANWFCENDFFEEVFLFMDCCRDITIVPHLNIYFGSRGNSTKAKKYYAFASGWSRRAKEKPMPDENGKYRGIFSKVLLHGLNGAAADPNPTEQDKGIITAASLSSYLYQNIPKLLDPEYPDYDPKSGYPDIDFYPKINGGKDIEIVPIINLKKFPIIFSIPKDKRGCLKITDSNNKQVIDPISLELSSKQIKIDLPRGIFTASINNNESHNNTLFSVTGIEDILTKTIELNN